MKTFLLIFVSCYAVYVTIYGLPMLNDKLSEFRKPSLALKVEHWADKNKLTLTAVGCDYENSDDKDEFTCVAIAQGKMKPLKCSKETGCHQVSIMESLPNFGMGL